jgi:uncharacterized secreted protein with C-terminal beta-propeller domain
MQKEIKKSARLYGIVAILLAAVLISACYQFGSIPLISVEHTSSFMSTFSSYDELREFLQTATKSQYGCPYYTRSGEVFTFGGSQAAFGPAIADVNKIGGTEYSGTNVQVTGVDEADNVKNDGTYIYVLAGNKVSILKAFPPTEAQLLSTIAFNDMIPSGIFVNNNTLAVLGSNYTTTTEPFYSATGLPYLSYVGETSTFLELYDISNRSSPGLLKTVTTGGGYLSSRMIGEYIYIVAGQPAYYRIEILSNIFDRVDLPKIGIDGQIKEVTASEIYYSNATDEYFTFTTILAVNTQNMTESANSKTLMIGGTSTMYVSSSDMYVTYTAYDQNWNGYDQTSIYRIHVENNTITPQAQGKVPGHILNQFSMDQYGDYFRVVTTTWGYTIPNSWGLPNSTITPPSDNVTILNITISPLPSSWVSPVPIVGAQQTNVYVLDMNLSIVGRLENLARGENFHSARFMGNRCYLVTFMNIDPLFVIDLSNPTKPTELGNLTIPGYSDYLHPYDENHLIGVGKETTASEQGFFAWYQGVKISLFDVSNMTNPIQLANYIIGDRGTTSPVLDDHRAFLFDKTQNLLVIPIVEAKIDQSQYPPGQVPANAYGQTVWQGAYVFNITLDSGFMLKGKITHLESGIDVWNSTYHIERSLYIDDVLYTVSNAKVKLNSLENLAFIKEIAIN